MTVTQDLVPQLQEELRQSQDMELVLRESLADLELAMEDRGWQAIGAGGREFSAGHRSRVADICRSQAIGNPMLKRAINVRIGYIWGQGVEIQARDETVNDLIQDFIDNNLKTLFGSQANEELERALGTDGEVYLGAYTLPVTGKVQCRSIPAEEIQDIINNPDDRDEVWYYVREFDTYVMEPGYVEGNTRARKARVRELHPELSFWPTSRPRTINGLPVRWDAPVLQVPVNRLDGWQHGIPDVYASLAWARLYRDFLVDWAGLTKALSKIAFNMTGDTKARTNMAAAAARASSTEAGQTFVAGPGIGLEAVGKSGATIDSQSGKPLAAMVAAGMGLPVTYLLADPGTTGARAVAETLDWPTILEMAMRRLLWQFKLTELMQYVIDQSVLAPKGELRGTLGRDDWGKLRVNIAEDRTVEFEWPSLTAGDPVALITALVSAQSTELLPDLVFIRTLLPLLGVKNVDEVIEENTDDAGNWIRPEVTAGQAAVDSFNRGGDPADETR